MAYQFEEESRKDAKRGLILERVYSTRKIPEKLNTIYRSLDKFSYL